MYKEHLLTRPIIIRHFKIIITNLKSIILTIQIKSSIINTQVKSKVHSTKLIVKLKGGICNNAL